MRSFSHAVIAAGIVLLCAVPAAQADVRVGQNYRLNSDSNPFRGKDAVGLAVNPANAQHVVAVHANYLTETCEGTASFDGGVTWSPAADLVPPTPAIGLPFQPSCRISNHLGESMYQTVAFGSGQTVYATSITPRAAVSGEEGAAAIVFKSTNGGVTWGPGVVALAGGPGTPSGPAGGPYHELPTVAVDRGAAPAGADRVIVAAREVTGNGNSGPPCPVPAPPAVPACASVRVAVSNDSGATYAAPVQASPTGVPIAGPDSASPPVVNPDHSISIAWRTSGVTGNLQVARSVDQGQTFGAPVTVAVVTNNARSSADHVTVQPSNGSSFPRLAGNATNGNLYIVYNQGPPGPTAPPGGFTGADHFITPDSHVYFQRSLDNGVSWSTPKLINDNTSRPGAETVQTRHPTVSVAPNGRVDIVWEDRRHWYQGPGLRNCIHTHVACDDARLGDTYYSYSTDHGATFTDDRRISDHSHNNDLGYDYRFGTGWAYGPQAVPLGNDTLLVGWMDTREGNTDTDTQDIYLAKVNFSATSTVPQTTVDAPSATALSVALSNRSYLGGGESVLTSTFATRPASKVVIVNEGDVAGALAGGVLARAFLGPVLLSPAAGLPDSVKAEVSRLSPIGAYVIGDTAALSAQVVSDLAAAGVDPAQVVRVAGSSRAGTAAAIAALYDRRSDAEKLAGNPAFDAAVIANPDGPDAVAASALAAARRLPVLYVDADSAPSSTLAALNSLDITKTLVIGGAAQISETLLNGLPSATRLGGADQFATSRAVAAESVSRGLPSNIVYAANGARAIDAALLGPAVGRSTGIMVLSAAPVAATAASAATAAGLTGIDRIVTVQSAPPVAPPPPPVAPPPPAAVPPPPPAAAAPARCGRVQLVKRNVSKTVTRADTRVRLPCAGKLTVRATSRLRGADGKVRTVRLKTSIVIVSGARNRSIRTSLSTAAARRTLRRNGRLSISLRATFVPRVLSVQSKRSVRTFTITVRRAR